MQRHSTIRHWGMVSFTLFRPKDFTLECADISTMTETGKRLWISPKSMAKSKLLETYILHLLTKFQLFPRQRRCVGNQNALPLFRIPRIAHLLLLGKCDEIHLLTN